MELNKYEPLKNLDTASFNWKCRLRLQAAWKGLNSKIQEFWGSNMLFIDDSNTRIHAFANAKYYQKDFEDLTEGAIYILSNFKVKDFNGDETYRPVRNEKHIYFTENTQLKKETEDGLQIEDYAFDLRTLSKIEKYADDNRFLIDMLGKMENLQPKFRSNKNADKTLVKFELFDGRHRVNVTFFDKFGDEFEENVRKFTNDDIYIIIACARVGRYDDSANLTNYPATKVYINPKHYSVKELQCRMEELATIDIAGPVVDVEKILLTVKAIKELPSDFKETTVSCKVTVKKIDDKVSWYYAWCSNCEKEIELEKGKYKCSKCTRLFPHPDKRFRLSTLCSDNTGSIAIIFPDDEIIRITGKTVFDIEAECVEDAEMDEFPEILRQFRNQEYNITLEVKEENIKKGSRIFDAIEIYQVVDYEGSFDQDKPNAMEIEQTTNLETEKETIDDQEMIQTPQTGKSTTTKTKVRKIFSQLLMILRTTYLQRTKRTSKLKRNDFRKEPF